MSGREAAEKMRELRPGLPVLFTTGYSRHFIENNFSLEENLSLIKKPFISSDLLRAIRGVIDEGKAGEE